MIQLFNLSEYKLQALHIICEILDACNYLSRYFLSLARLGLLPRRCAMNSKHGTEEDPLT